MKIHGFTVLFVFSSPAERNCYITSMSIGMITASCQVKRLMI